MGKAATTLKGVSWRGNAAGRGADDVCVSGDATPIGGLSNDAEVIATPLAGVGSYDEANLATASFSVGGGLVIAHGPMLGLECGTEALEMLDMDGMERVALALLEHASSADPRSPNLAQFHLNLLYTHGIDSHAAARLAAFRKAVGGEHGSIHALASMLGNESVVSLRMRGRTINGQLSRMRGGLAVVVPHASRLLAQDAASEAFLQALVLDETDGDTWHDLGTSLFFGGELSESYDVYEYGRMRSKAEHQGLESEEAKLAAFPAAPRASSNAVAAAWRADLGGPKSAFVEVRLPAGSYRDVTHDFQAGAELFGEEPSIFVSSTPLVPKETCAKYVAAAEAWGAKHGWTTSRHYSVATTDIPLIQLPELLPSFNEAMHSLLLPALSAVYPQAAPDASRLRVFDCFLVRYDAKAQASLKLHSDQSLLSFTIALNDPSEYEGGGTFFRGLGRAVDAPAAGHAVLFPGKVEHGGHPITKGLRYIIVLFMGYDSNRLSSRPAGYTLRRFQELGGSTDPDVLAKLRRSSSAQDGAGGARSTQAEGKDEL